jgi:tRNA G18 (ribose-2'-O)-methylase SpoU
MATLVPVEDPSDPRLADYLHLTDVALRRRREPAEGLFIAEGETVIRRALIAGYAARSLLCAPNRVSDLADVLERCDVPLYVADRPVLAELTGFDVHRGALAAMARRPLATVQEVLRGADRVVVLEDVVDHTNVGAVFRAAAGLCMDAVLLSHRCADPLYRRAVRVSMGAVLTLPYARLPRWDDALEQVRAAGLTVLALTPAADALPLDRLPASDTARCALVLGTEGPGLSARWLAAADRRVRIPMGGGVDSLNVGAAAAVACWAVRPR